MAQTLLTINPGVQGDFANTATPTEGRPGDFTLTDAGRNLSRNLQSALLSGQGNVQRESSRHLITTWAQIYSAMMKLGLVVKEAISPLTSGPKVSQEFVESDDFVNISAAMRSMHISPTTIGFDPYGAK